MNYIVFDLEATCWEGDYDRPETNPQTEITEIGAVKLNEKLEIIDTFQTFVKPILNPQLSEFAKTLTSIKQEDIDAAPDFTRALLNFQYWIQTRKGDNKNYPYYLCSWGFYDRKQLTADCTLHMKDTTWLENHISIKHQDGQIRATEFLADMDKRKAEGEQITDAWIKNRYERLARGLGMPRALDLHGLEMEGTHHRGIDDAKNIAKIFVKIFPQLKFGE